MNWTYVSLQSSAMIVIMYRLNGWSIVSRSFFYWLLPNVSRTICSNSKFEWDCLGRGSNFELWCGVVGFGLCSAVSGKRWENGRGRERERERALSLQSLIIKIMYELSICAKERPKLTSTRNKFTGAQRSANVSPTNLLVSLLQTVTS